MGEARQQQTLMKFDPATGALRPYPSHATQWREWHGNAAWLFNPWNGRRRDARDIGSDVSGVLIIAREEKTELGITDADKRNK